MLPVPILYPAHLLSLDSPLHSRCHILLFAMPGLHLLFLSPVYGCFHHLGSACAPPFLRLRSTFDPLQSEAIPHSSIELHIHFQSGAPNYAAPAYQPHNQKSDILTETKNVPKPALPRNLSPAPLSDLFHMPFNLLCMIALGIRHFQCHPIFQTGYHIIACAPIRNDRPLISPFLSENINK